MLNAELVMGVRLPEAAVRVYPVPAVLMERPAKVATPFEAETVEVPKRVPPDGLLVIVRAIEAEEPETVLP
jgi:hypothetical protein